jgi:fucokinase
MNRIFSNNSLEIACFSDLPAGSGMGGSSIVAATILYSVSSLLFDNKQTMSESLLMDFVSYVEQLLTTGGGYQDQVGGCFGGFKLCSSRPCLPLTLAVEPIILENPLFLKRFRERVYLIYSGKQVSFIVSLLTVAFVQLFCLFVFPFLCFLS